MISSVRFFALTILICTSAASTGSASAPRTVSNSKTKSSSDTSSKLTIYPKSPLHFSSHDGFSARDQYYPCAPVSVLDAANDLTYLGRRCPDQNDIEVYQNIRYAVESPLVAAGGIPGGNSSSRRPPPTGGAAGERTGVSVFTYPAGATVDTSFPFAYCRQMPGLAWSLMYEQMRDVEEPGICPAQIGHGKSSKAEEISETESRPIPEDCLTLSVIRPADLPRDLTPLIAPEARKSTHTRGLLPVTLIIDESGPDGGDGDDNVVSEDGKSDNDDDEMDAGGPGGGVLKSRAGKRKHSKYGKQSNNLRLNAGQIVARDMAAHGLGRIIVLANYRLLDKARAHTIMQTLRQGLAIASQAPPSNPKDDKSKPTAGICRTPLEFERLSRSLRQRNLASAAPIEWPTFGSARAGRQHAPVLKEWIERNIEKWRGDPGWLQEVVILPEGAGAMTRSTTDPDWRASRLVSEEALAKEKEDIARTGEGERKMVMNMQL